MSSTLAKTIRATTESYLSGFVRASQTKNMREMSSDCTEDCRRHIGPDAYLELVGAPPGYSMSNTEYESQFNTMAFYKLNDCVISHLVVDADELKAAAKSELIGAFVDGRKISRTNMWFLDFTPDGKKVSKSYQHIDHHEGEQFRKTLAEYKKAKADKDKETNGEVEPDIKTEDGA
ncbi:hypothetical protein CC79DRAFT_1321896 [Sarocladium strictum]